MAENESAEEKTEQASTQRREEFRESGQVAQSREVSTILIIMGVTVVFYFLSRQLLVEISELFSTAFTENFIAAARQDDLVPIAKLSLKKLFMILLPIFGITLVMGVGATVAQVGFLTAWEQINPDIERLNPINGFKKIFNLRSAVEGLKSVIKIVIVASVAFLIIKNELTFTPQIVQFTVPQVFSYIGHVLFRLLGGFCALMTLLAILDYGFQRWELEKRMRMTKQEVKEEFKQREGDPLIKSRIRRIQRDLAQKRMMEKVPKADVIITNPTHIAVALQYDRESMAVPIVVAKGADFIAEKIKEIARQHNIPVVENKPLARTIYKTLKVGQAIPRSLFNAVAEVLAYVYRIKGRIREMADKMDQENPGGRV